MSDNLSATWPVSQHKVSGLVEAKCWSRRQKWGCHDGTEGFLSLFFFSLLTWQFLFYQWQGLKSHLEFLLSVLVWKVFANFWEKDFLGLDVFLVWGTCTDVFFVMIQNRKRLFPAMLLWLQSPLCEEAQIGLNFQVVNKEAWNELIMTAEVSGLKLMVTVECLLYVLYQDQRSIV